MSWEAVPEGGGRCADAWVVVRVTPAVAVPVCPMRGSMTDAGAEVTVGASGRVVGSVGRGSRSWTCSLKCVQRVVTPVVAQVLISRRVRCPSFSVQSRRCGLRSVRCCGVQRPVQSCPRCSTSRWWKSKWWIARPNARVGPGRRRCTMSPRSCAWPSRSVATPGHLQRM